MDISSHLRRVWGRTEAFWLKPTDTRLYGLVRITFCVMALINWAYLYPHRYQLLAFDGLLGGNMGPRLRSLSIFRFFGIHVAVDLALWIALMAIVALLVGVVLRPAVLVIYLYSVGYCYWATFQTSSWDVVLRMGFFALLLSPLGDPYCLKYRGKKAPALGSRHGLMLLRIQVSIIYLATFWSKAGDAAWRDGEFVQYFLLSLYAHNVFGETLLSFPLVNNLLTYGTLIIELSVPILLWFPRGKWLAFFLGYNLHLGIALSSRLWLFSLVMMSSYVVFLEPEDLVRLRSLWRQASAQWTALITPRRL